MKCCPRCGLDLKKALTPREREVIELLSKGGQNKEIAYRLGLQPDTIKQYLFHIFQKVGVTNRVELAVKAAKGEL